MILWRLIIAKIPAERQAASTFEYYLSSLLATIINVTIVVLRNINIGFVNMFRSVGIS